MHYYNEFDQKAAAWLRALMDEGLIPKGDVDERSITEVKSGELVRYTQCHFFAGIGGWALALRLAGWPEDEPAWSGSCPCQPFSAAGKQAAFADPRHLWPVWLPLIAECRPPAVFGEQTDKALGRMWLARVRADLEALGYAVGGADLCSAGINAPNIRQRLYWVAERGMGNPKGDEQRRDSDGAHGPREQIGGPSDVRRLGESIVARLEGHSGHEHDRDQSGRERTIEAGSTAAAGDTGFWANGLWHQCSDKLRRIPPESPFFPLAPRIPGRVAMLKGFGNAINPEVAAEFIRAYIETTQ